MRTKVKRRNYAVAPPEDVVNITTQTTTTQTGSWWESVLSSLPGILGGSADLARGVKGVPNESTNVYQGDSGKNNTMLFVGIGAAVLVVIVIVVVMMKK